MSFTGSMTHTWATYTFWNKHGYSGWHGPERSAIHLRSREWRPYSWVEIHETYTHEEVDLSRGRLGHVLLLQTPRGPRSNASGYWADQITD